MKYRFDKFELDTVTLLLLAEGRNTELEPRAVELLIILIECWPDCCESGYLLQRLWPKTVVSAWSLSRLVSDCRKQLKELGYAGPVIQTLHGKGYRLAPELAAILQPVSESPVVLPDTGSAAPSRQWLLPALMTAAALIAAFWLFPVDLHSRQNGPALRIAEASGTVARVLWVDDNPANNKRETAYLKQNNIAVYAVESTEDAMLLLSLYRYDAVISDMGRAGEPLAGLKLLQQMRDKNITTAFFLYSIFPSDNKDQLLQQYGAQGVASEPDELYRLLWPVLLP